jgi:hypothetical protein
VGSISFSGFLVDARHGLRLAIVQLLPFRGRAFGFAPALPRLGGCAARRPPRLVGAGALGFAYSEPDHNLRRCGGKSRMVSVLMALGQNRTVVGQMKTNANKRI